MKEIELPDGTVRKLGNNMPTKGLDPSWQVYGETSKAPMVPRSKWPQLMEAYDDDHNHPNLPPLHDQNGVGQCNPEATTTGVEFERTRQGLEYVQLSPADLYSRINWGQDGGSLLEDAMAKMLTEGVGTAATSGLLWKNGSFKGPAPSQERGRFRVLEAWLCPTFDHFFSAALMGFSLINGIGWYNNYMPGTDGWLPKGRGNSGGHALFGYKPAKRGAGNSIQYGVWHQQSWGDTWSPRTGNRMVISEEAMEGPVGGWWAIRGVVDEGGVIPVPQAA